MSVAANGIHQLSSRSDIAKKSGIKLSRSRRLSNGRRGACDTLGKSKKLAPGLVYRRRIAPIRLVRLGYVAVVEDARNRVGAHASKFNCALRSSAHSDWS